LARKLVETTRYSLSSSPPMRPDRRQGDRYVTLLRVGALTIDGRRELCLIRNVSAGGMMIRPYSAVAPGTPVRIELKHGDSVSGIAQWSENGLVGVAFDQSIDILALLTSPTDAPRPRMPRIELDCSAVVRRDGDVFRAQVINISQGGICIGTESAIDVDSDVVVSLPGLHSAAGVVKWREGDEYGIGFNRVYPIDELMRFLQEQQGNEQRFAAAG
jgi:hypothetical protein